MVECARLEIVLRGNTYGGSNPLLCAIIRRTAFAVRRIISCAEYRGFEGRQENKLIYFRRSADSTADKTVDTHCFLCAAPKRRILFSAPKQADSFCYSPVLLFGMGMKTFVGSYRRIRADPPRDEQGIFKQQIPAVLPCEKSADQVAPAVTEATDFIDVAGRAKGVRRHSPLCAFTALN